MCFQNLRVRYRMQSIGGIDHHLSGFLIIDCEIVMELILPE
jgi:hypothetical protein